MENNNGTETKIISQLGIPVQIFILYLVQNKKSFTVNGTIAEFEKAHKIVLNYSRMKQILDDLVLSDNLTVEFKGNGSKNKKTAFYTFKKIF